MFAEAFVSSVNTVELGGSVNTSPFLKGKSMDEILVSMRESFYNNVDPRRKQEWADSRMINEDHYKMANCPEKPINRQFNAWKYPERLAMYNQSQKIKGQK